MIDFVSTFFYLAHEPELLSVLYPHYDGSLLRLNNYCRSSLACRSLGRSLARSVARSIDHSLARSLARSIARSLTDMCSLQSQYKGGGLRPPPQRGPRGLRRASDRASERQAGDERQSLLTHDDIKATSKTEATTTGDLEKVDFSDFTMN